MSRKHLAVWICNILIAILSILSIICYFFGSFWRFSATVTLTAETFEDLIKKVPAEGDGNGDSPLKDLDMKEIVGEDGVKIAIAFQIGVDDIFASVGGSAEEVYENLVDKNVTSIVEDLEPVLTDVTKNALKSVAKTTVKQQIHENVQDHLASSEEETQEKLEALGITDEYIGDKMDQIINSVFAEGSNVNKVADDIMKTVEEAYTDINEKATELSKTDPSYEDLTDIALTDEKKADIRSNVVEILDELATGENGEINAGELIDKLLSRLLSGLEGSGTGSSENEAAVARLAAQEDGGEPSSEGGTEGGSNNGGEAAEDFETHLKNFILKYTDSAAGYAKYVFLGMGGLMLLSMLAWLYILIKLIVKFFKKGPNPTVKLKCPIWLGWLPYLILVAVPGIALLLLPTLLPRFGVAEDVIKIFNSVSLSVSSISIIALISAGVCFAISIFYMVVRRKIKKEAQGAQ